MVNPLRVTYYERTGYNLSDEPASDAVIDLNRHWDMSRPLVEYDASNRSQQALKVELTDDEALLVDFVKLTDTITNDKWYYYVMGYRRLNTSVVLLQLLLDSFATVGLRNLRFFGNIVRRSLTPAESTSYAILPEPWAPRRPLRMRRIILDLNINKVAKLPSHVSLNFEAGGSTFSDTETIHVPNSPLGFSTFDDSLSIEATLPMGYPTPATDTAHRVSTPWGDLEYVTPIEQYYTLAGSALSTFLADSKKYNALDLVSPPYYVPSPGQIVNVQINELSNPGTRNPKASRFYTTMTIRSLASGSSRTFSEQDTILHYEQPLGIMVLPDKMGGLYVLPTTLRDFGLSPYSYLEGVYSPFETVVYNAVGDTPAKFAADGTILMNQALNTLFNTYIQKINALQMEGMQAKYLKDLGSVKAVVMAFTAEFLGSKSETVTTTEAYTQEATSESRTAPVSQHTEQVQSIPEHLQTQVSATDGTGGQSTTSVTQVRSTNSTDTTNTYVARGPEFPEVQQGSWINTRSSSSGTSTTPAYSTTTTNPGGNSSVSGQVVVAAHEISITSDSLTSESVQTSVQSTNIPSQRTSAVTTQESARRSVEEGNAIAIDGINPIYESTAPALSAAPTWGTLQTLMFGGYRNEVHSFMLGNINDYLNRWASVQNDLHNGKVANLFKNITLVGQYADANKLAGKYEIVIASLQPEDEHNFDLYLDHFGHAVDEYSDTLVKDVGRNYAYTMVGEDAIISNTVKQASSQQILNQFRTGVRVWKTLIRPENY